MVAIGQQSYANISNLFYGFWSHVHVTEDPTGVGTEYYLGAAQEAVLEISREDTELLSTTFPQTVEVVIPTRSGMRMSGRLDEMHKANLHLLNNDLPGTTNNYIYPGVACPDETKFVRFVARRIRCDGFVMEALMWKAQNGGLIQIGGEAGVVGTPFDISALDDINGDFGGSIEAPLGYIYAPDPAV